MPDLSQAKPIVTPAPIAPKASAAPATPPVTPAAPAPTTPAVEPVVEPVVAPVEPTVVPDELNLTPAVSDTPAVGEQVAATGIKQFDSVGKLLQDKAVPNANAIMKDILATGEVSLANKAALVETLGETVADMAINQVESAATSMKTEAKVERSRLMDYATERLQGSDAAATWKGMQSFAQSEQSGFSADDRVQMNTMLKKGGFQAELVIDKIASAYERSTGFTQEAQLLSGDSRSASTFEPLSRNDYAAQKREAVQQHGEYSHQVQALEAKRTESIRRGF